VLAGVGTPIARAGAGTIRIGHLAPRTGPFGPLGDHAVMGVQLAAEHINAMGGLNGHRIALLLEDSSDSRIACAKAGRLVTRDRVTLLIGEAELGRWLIRVGGRDPIAMPASFAATFKRRYGKLPQTPAWADYVMLRAAMCKMS